MNITDRLKSIGLILTGILSLGYLLFWRMFAEIHIRLFNLNFPIFIGEIFMFALCFIWLAICILEKKKCHIAGYLLLLYFLIVWIKAVYGYFACGPLALRHAALFYYPLFAVFGYTFYRRDFFGSDKIRLIICLIFLSAFAFIVYRRYYSLTCALLCFMLIRTYPAKPIKYMLLGLFLICVPYFHFFAISRSFFIANFASSIFVLVAFLIILNIPRIYKIALVLLFAVFMAVGFVNISTKHAIGSLFNFEKTLKTYREIDSLMLQRKKDFKMESLDNVKIFNPEIISSYFITPPSGVPKAAVPAKKDESVAAAVPDVAIIEPAGINGATANNLNTVGPAKGLKPVVTKASIATSGESSGVSYNKLVNETNPSVVSSVSPEQKDAAWFDASAYNKSLNESQPSKGPSAHSVKNQILKMMSWNDILNRDKAKDGLKLRQTEVEYHDIIFRFFIWRDLLKEFVSKKAFVFGVSFGKPFRSISLEILDWAGSEWARDGWISIHNGYLDIIYRAGLMGAVFIIFLMATLFKMVRVAVHYRLIDGILLCGILVNWLVAANFLEILELPYYSIPFWSLSGMTLGYLRYHTDKATG